MSLVKLFVKGIAFSHSAHTGSYALVLSEVEGDRTLSIVIGSFEAQAIAVALEKNLKPPRPLTHDLFKSFADRFEIIVKQVIIHKLVDGVFYSSMICERDKIEEIIDARTSDAIALAMRFSAPIFTYKNILEKAGIVAKHIKTKDEQEVEFEGVVFTPDNGDDEDENDFQNVYYQKNLDELHNMLRQAVEAEDYVTAAKIRDEISKR